MCRKTCSHFSNLLNTTTLDNHLDSFIAIFSALHLSSVFHFLCRFANFNQHIRRHKFLFIKFFSFLTKILPQHSISDRAVVFITIFPQTSCHCVIKFQAVNCCRRFVESKSTMFTLVLFMRILVCEIFGIFRCGHNRPESCNLASLRIYLKHSFERSRE